MNNNNFTRGLILGGIIGATIGGMMNRDQSYRMRRKIMRAGRNAFSRRNGIVDAIMDMF